jgi:hypothetical protein
MLTSGSGMGSKWKEFNMEGRTSLDEEDCARDFCEELRCLMDIHETRGLVRKRMGQAMVGFGAATLKDACDKKIEAARICEKTIHIWLEDN